MKTGKMILWANFFVIWLHFVGNKCSLSNCQVVLTSQQMHKEVRKHRTITSNQRVLSSAYSPFVSQQRNETCLTNVHAATRGHLARLFFIASENRILGEYSGMCRVLLLVLVGTSVKGCYFLSPFMLQFSWTESFRQKAHISWIPAVGVFPS